MKTETRKLGPLNVQHVVKEGPSDGNNDATGGAPLTVVLLHGFGAPGDDLVSLASAFAQLGAVPNGTSFFFPAALHPLSKFVGAQAFDARCWWMIDFAAIERAMLTGELRDLSREVPEGLDEARDAVVAMLEALKKEHSPKRLVIGGFSQGAMLSLDVALRHPEIDLAGVVQLSGTLLAENEWSPLMKKLGEKKTCPIFQSHGTVDPILPYDMAERLRDRLKENGVDVTFDPFNGPHAIPPKTLMRLSDWLSARAG